MRQDDWASVESIEACSNLISYLAEATRVKRYLASQETSEKLCENFGCHDGALAHPSTCRQLRAPLVQSLAGAKDLKT